MLVLKILFIVLLLVIFYQDLKFQAVSWILFPIGILIGFLVLKAEYSIKLFSINLFINIGFISFQMLIILLYFRLKYKGFSGVFQKAFGIGDLLFFIMITPLFSPLNYIAFFIASMFFSLLIFILLTKMKLYKNSKIPLAGFQSIFLVIIICLGYFLNWNFYSDLYILTELNII
jgi:hypothetical protein